MTRRIKEYAILKISIMVRDFAISTNHPFNQYKGGQTVKGRIHFKLDIPKTVRGVYVKLKGLAKVQWTESKTRTINGKSRTTHVTYYGEHGYFNEKIYIIGEDNGESFELPSGEYNYKFSYNLPVGLPSSYEETYGSIRYTAKAVLDIPWRFDDEEEVDLQILSSIDLNSRPQLKNPVHVSGSKYLCCLWCRSGLLTMEIDVPKTGFVQGEAIHIQADVENLTNSKVYMLECKLKQKVTFHSEYPSHHTRECKTTVCCIQLDGIPVRSSKTYNEKLIIPKQIVLNFDNCSLFDIEHVLQVKARIDGCHVNLSVKIPIMMGSVPLMLEESSVSPKSILAGLGNPYPHETNSTYLFNREYGWMMGYDKI